MPARHPSRVILSAELALSEVEREESQPTIANWSEAQVPSHVEGSQPLPQFIARVFFPQIYLRDAVDLAPAFGRGCIREEYFFLTQTRPERRSLP